MYEYAIISTVFDLLSNMLNVAKSSHFSMASLFLRRAMSRKYKVHLRNERGEQERRKLGNRKELDCSLSPRDEHTEIQ